MEGGYWAAASVSGWSAALSTHLIQRAAPWFKSSSFRYGPPAPSGLETTPATDRRGGGALDPLEELRIALWTAGPAPRQLLGGGGRAPGPPERPTAGGQSLTPDRLW